MAAEIIKLDKFRKSRKPRRTKTKSALKPKRFGKGHNGLKWSAFKTAPLTTPIAAELMRDQLAGPPREDDPLLESGVLAFRREENGDQQVLLISRKRSKKWGIPKGKCVPSLNFPENAAKEAFEEAGVLGYVSPFSVGVFRAKKRVGVPQIQQMIEV
jgi:hypothetical protein